MHPELLDNLAWAIGTAVGVVFFLWLKKRGIL